MPRPRLLDLFCGAGGAAMGYSRAGFDVTGVDIEPQPHYPFEFLQHDAMELLNDLADYGPQFVLEDAYGPIAAIHASPPCEFATTMNVRWRNRGNTIADQHVNLLTPTVAVLRQLGLPYIVENVIGAGQYFRPTLLLHGGMFGLGVHRPRLFECSELILAELMGMPWADWDGCRKAIPPAYTEHIGRQLIDALAVTGA